MMNSIASDGYLTSSIQTTLLIAVAGILIGQAAVSPAIIPPGGTTMYTQGSSHSDEQTQRYRLLAEDEELLLIIRSIW